jgi:hypothetical protein
MPGLIEGSLKPREGIQGGKVGLGGLFIPDCWCILLFSIVQLLGKRLISLNHFNSSQSEPFILP